MGEEAPKVSAAIPRQLRLRKDRSKQRPTRAYVQALEVALMEKQIEVDRLREQLRGREGGGSEVKR